MRRVGAAAISFAILTILIGTLVLADLGPGPAIRRLVSGHVLLALLGALVLAVAAFGSSAAVTATSLVILLVAVALGVLTWRRTTADPGAAKKPVSNGMLIAHGAGAALTIVFVVLAAAR